MKTHDERLDKHSLKQAAYWGSFSGPARVIDSLISFPIFELILLYIYLLEKLQMNFYK